MLAAQFAHRVVCDAGEVQADMRRSNVLDGRIRQRNDLPIIAKLVHFPKPRIKIEKLGDAPQSLPDIFQIWRHFRHFLEITIGKDVAINIDDRTHDVLSFSRVSCRCRGMTCQPKRSAISPQIPFGAHNITMMATAPIISK